jgi:hypothetical protein
MFVPHLSESCMHGLIQNKNKDFEPKGISIIFLLFFPDNYYFHPFQNYCLFSFFCIYKIFVTYLDICMSKYITKAMYLEK